LLQAYISAADTLQCLITLRPIHYKRLRSKGEMPQHKGISSKTYKPQSGRDRLYFNFSMSASYLKWRSTGAVSVSVAPVSI